MSEIIPLLKIPSGDYIITSYENMFMPIMLVIFYSWDPINYVPVGNEMRVAFNKPELVAFTSILQEYLKSNQPAKLHTDNGAIVVHPSTQDGHKTTEILGSLQLHI